MFFAKAKFLKLFFIASTMIGLTSCSTVSKVFATPTPDRTSEIRPYMENYNQCFSHMNADCVAAFFAPQGQIFDTGLIRAAGPAAVRSYLNQTFRAAHIDSLNATIDTITINGDVGVVLGIYD